MQLAWCHIAAYHGMIYLQCKAYAQSRQKFATGCVSSTDCGTTTGCHFFGLGSEVGCRKSGYFFRAPAPPILHFFRGNRMMTRNFTVSDISPCFGAVVNLVHQPSIVQLSKIFFVDTRLSSGHPANGVHGQPSKYAQCSATPQREAALATMAKRGQSQARDSETDKHSAGFPCPPKSPQQRD